jgi:hypothetical protein
VNINTPFLFCYLFCRRDKKRSGGKGGASPLVLRSPESASASPLQHRLRTRGLSDPAGLPLPVRPGLSPGKTTTADGGGEHDAVISRGHSGDAQRRTRSSEHLLQLRQRWVLVRREMARAAMAGGEYGEYPGTTTSVRASSASSGLLCRKDGASFRSCGEKPGRRRRRRRRRVLRDRRIPDDPDPYRWPSPEEREATGRGKEKRGACRPISGKKTGRVAGSRRKEYMSRKHVSWPKDRWLNSRQVVSGASCASL